MDDYTQIDYSVFTDSVITELSKIPAQKHRKQAIKILEYLKENSNDMILKKNLSQLFGKEYRGIEAYAQTLENICAITYRKIGTSYLYQITPIGEKMLEILKQKN